MSDKSCSKFMLLNEKKQWVSADFNREKLTCKPVIFDNSEHNFVKIHEVYLWSIFYL